MGSPHGIPIWDPHMGSPHGIPIWDPHMGSPYGNPIWKPYMGSMYPCRNPKRCPGWTMSGLGQLMIRPTDSPRIFPSLATYAAVWNSDRCVLHRFSPRNFGCYHPGSQLGPTGPNWGSNLGPPSGPKIGPKFGPPWTLIWALGPNPGPLGPLGPWGPGGPGCCLIYSLNSNKLLEFCKHGNRPGTEEEVPKHLPPCFLTHEE